MKDTMSHLRLALGKKKRAGAKKPPSYPNNSITHLSGNMNRYSALAKKKRGY